MKNIDPNSKWLYITQQCDIENSTNDYLTFTREGMTDDDGNEVITDDDGSVKYNQIPKCDIDFLKKGYSKLSSDHESRKKMISDIQNKIECFEELINEKGGDSHRAVLLKGNLLLRDVLYHFEQNARVLGKQLSLSSMVEEDTVSDDDKNPINLGHICSNYGMGDAVRNKFFLRENQQGVYHQAITGRQCIIGSPLYATNIHKEHGKVWDFVNHLFKGNKLWLFAEAKDGQDLEEEFAKIIHGIRCATNVWFHYQCWFIIKFIEFVANNDNVIGYFLWQRAGETVIARGNVYHQVISLNYTICEAINVADNCWLKWDQFYFYGIAAQIEYKKLHPRHNGNKQCKKYGNKCILIGEGKDKFDGDEYCQNWMDGQFKIHDLMQHLEIMIREEMRSNLLRYQISNVMFPNSIKETPRTEQEKRKKKKGYTMKKRAALTNSKTRGSQEVEPFILKTIPLR